MCAAQILPMADAVLLDTGIVSIFLKTSLVHQQRRTAIEAEIRGKIAVISFVTVAELFFWAEKANWGESRRANLDDQLRHYDVLHANRTTAKLWARTKLQCELAGIAMGANDLWIASAALEYGLPLVTTDRDFSAIASLAQIKL